VAQFEPRLRYEEVNRGSSEAYIEGSSSIQSRVLHREESLGEPTDAEHVVSAFACE